ncbi:hypothetical protein CEXT_623401 [Caerostris extrusa]|uniref:Uncharacterized protein n=1 Tax=Caerostris extrusa TaxID=172846 RepID=A0AAV4NYY4_CAEEX|nr:hypothetical protein CEXT_623401 [Caerostris extrusa]
MSGRESRDDVLCHSSAHKSHTRHRRKRSPFAGNPDRLVSIWPGMLIAYYDRFALRLGKCLQQRNLVGKWELMNQRSST